MSTPRERIEEVGKKIKREADVVTDRTGRRLSLVGTINTITPCAACKLLRRRCAQDCPFAPYFAPHEPQRFASVHKVFGASNISKMLLEVPESQRADAANSLVYEANLRLRDPIYGCMGAISALQQQVQALELELQAVRAEILKHKFRQASAGVIPTSHAAFLAPSEAVSMAAPPPRSVTSPPPALGSSSSFMYTSLDSSAITMNHNTLYYG